MVVLVVHHQLILTIKFLLHYLSIFHQQTLMHPNWMDWSNLICECPFVATACLGCYWLSKFHRNRIGEMFHYLRIIKSDLSPYKRFSFHWSTVNWRRLFIQFVSAVRWPCLLFSVFSYLSFHRRRPSPSLAFIVTSDLVAQLHSLRVYSTHVEFEVEHMPHNTSHWWTIAVHWLWMCRPLSFCCPDWVGWLLYYCAKGRGGEYEEMVPCK